MFESIRKVFREGKKPPQARLPDGQRVYAIGDIHGRLDLFQALTEAIEQDDYAAPPADTTMILLGDLIDRGPESAGVIGHARNWQKRCKVRYLIGNHEEMMLDAFKSTNIMRHFLKHGGRETILSYGVTAEQFNLATTAELQQMMNELVPQADREFLKSFEEMIELGGYLFVHAGINPDRPLPDQRTRDTRWIRDPFLDSTKKHSHLVVHGHTIEQNVVARPNRIGIDTGAYRSGKLTALVLEGSRQRYIQAVQKKSGKIVIKQKETAE